MANKFESAVYAYIDRQPSPFILSLADWVNTHGIDTPFYAKDIGLSGGQIQSLDWAGLITSTANTRPEYVKNIDKEVAAMEWRVNKDAYEWQLERALAHKKAILDAIEAEKNYPWDR